MMARYFEPVLPRTTVISSGLATTLGLAVWLSLKSWSDAGATVVAGLIYVGALWLLRVATTDDLAKLAGRFRETVQGHARA